MLTQSANILRCLALTILLLGVLSAGLGASGFINARLEAITGEVDDIEGVLEIIVYDDFENHQSWNQYSLVTNHGRVQLAFKSADALPSNLTSGAVVRLRGRWLDQNRMLVLTNDSSDASAIQVMSDRPNRTIGEQNVLVLLVNFDPTVQPFTAEAVQSVLFADRADNANAFLRENSSNQTWLTGDVRGWFTVPRPALACDFFAIADAADAAAAAAGIPADSSIYNRRMYCMAGQFSDTCPLGSGTLGGDPSRAWIRQVTPFLISHELGHNLGLNHSHGLYWGGKLVFHPRSIGEVNKQEYGDAYSVMGEWLRAFHAREKRDLGWAQLRVVSAPGEYEIRAGDLDGEVVKAITIPAPGMNYSFDVEARRRVPAFDGSRQYDSVLNGVLLHVNFANDRNRTYLLDANPSNPPIVPSSDLIDPGLQAGQTFQDRASGVSITCVRSDRDKAVVSVQFGQPRPDPRIISAVIEHKDVIVTGENFIEGAQILLNGIERRTRIDPENPSRLISKKLGKLIRSGDTLRIKDSDGVLSAEIVFRRPQ